MRLLIGKHESISDAIHRFNFSLNRIDPLLVKNFDKKRNSFD